MTATRLVSLLACLIAICTVADAAIAQSQPFTKAMQQTFRSWLKANPSFRLLTEADCECDADIHLERTSGESYKPIPDYLPYRMVGDFRHNRTQDFAALVIRIAPKGRSTVFVLIFDGPFGGKGKRPSYFHNTGYAPANIGLFPAIHTGYPLVGTFESEGCIYAPKGTTYVEDCGDDY